MMEPITINRGAAIFRVWYNVSKSQREGYRVFDVQADNFNVRGVIYSYIQATNRDGATHLEYISRRNGGGRVTNYAREVVIEVISEVVATITDEQIHEQAIWIAEAGLQMARDERDRTLLDYLKKCQAAEKALAELQAIGGSGVLWPEHEQDAPEFTSVDSLVWKSQIDFARAARESADYMRQRGIYGQEPYLRMVRWADFFLDGLE